MKLLRFATGFALGTLLSRILGFLRDATIAYYFGATHISDAFFVAFRIPNSFRRLLGEGGFNAIFVPLYTRALEEYREREFLSRVFTFYTGAVCVLVLGGMLLSEQLVSLIAPGMREDERFHLAVSMSRFFFLYLLLVGLSAFFMGVLNVRGRFFVPAVAQGVFNLAFLISLLILAETYGYQALVVGVLVGGVFQLLIHIPFLLKEKIPLGFSLGWSKDVGELLKKLIPALGGFSINQLSLFIDTFLASFLKTGAVSYLYYAGRLYQLPFGIISVGVANSLLTLLSKRSSAKETELTNALGIVILLMLPASAGLFILSEDIIALVYGRGSFKEEDILVSSQALALYSLGLLPFSLQKVMSAYFFSCMNMRVPVLASLFNVLSEGAFAYTLAFLMGFGLLGLPAGTALSSLVGFSFLWLKMDVKPDTSFLFKLFFKSFTATLAMVAILLQVRDLDIDTFIKVPFLVLGGILVYLSSLYILREELSLALGKSFIKKLVNP